MKATPDIEARLSAIEKKLEALLDILVSGPQRGRYEYERALREANRGNYKPLQRYIEKGGKPV